MIQSNACKITISFTNSFGNPVRVLQMFRSATGNLNTPDDLTMVFLFLLNDFFFQFLNVLS